MAHDAYVNARFDKVVKDKACVKQEGTTLYACKDGTVLDRAKAD